ncbi:hypothetical protein AVEN_81280-1 [Araneus ventricosus]|nr:hypothetical protein AVEN_81280-1 [Araneus ventricosus]
MVLRRRNEDLNPKNLVGTVKYDGGSVFVWGCMSALGLVTRAAKSIHLKWCSDNRDWSTTDWDRVLFTIDVFRFNLENDSRCVKFWKLILNKVGNTIQASNRILKRRNPVIEVEWMESMDEVIRFKSDIIM